MILQIFERERKVIGWYKCHLRDELPEFRDLENWESMVREGYPHTRSIKEGWG